MFNQKLKNEVAARTSGVTAYQALIAGLERLAARY